MHVYDHDCKDQKKRALKLLRVVNLVSHTLALLAQQNHLTCAEILGESCEAYRMKLSPLEQKILMNIQLGVICANMVDYCRLAHVILCTVFVQIVEGCDFHCFCE